MFDIKSILVPVDFAECSKRGLEKALELARNYGASVTVLHTWVLPSYVSPSIAVSYAHGRTEELDAFARREAEDQLAQFMETVQKPAGVRIQHEIAYGSAHEVILARAKEHDLVVMGTHGRTGLNHVFLGSVTERVMRECVCPVLVVNARGA